MDDSTLSRGSEGKLQIRRESEYYGGGIRVKISVKNTSDLVITHVTLELESDDHILHLDRWEPEYPQNNGKIILNTIGAHNDATIAFYLDPLICAKEGTDINCRVNFKYADGTPDTVQMKKLRIQVVCPIFRTEHDINIGRLKELIEKLQSHDSKVYSIPKRVDITESLKICENVIEQHDVRHIKTFRTKDDKTYESWYFGKTKVTKKDLIIKCAIRKDTDSIEIFVSGNDPQDITGLLAELGRHITTEFKKIGQVRPVFNIVIKNSMIKGSNLLSFCDLNGMCGGNVVIDDESLVVDSNIASWIGEDKEKARIEEEKKLAEARKQEKAEQDRISRLNEQQEKVQRERKAQEEADRREKARLEQERKVRQREEAAPIQREKESECVPYKFERNTSGGKWLFGVVIILAVVALGWYVTADSGNPATHQETTPYVTTTPVMTKATPSTSSVFTSSANQKTITNSIGMDFVLMPAGEFDMGSPSNDKDSSDSERPIHRVKISNAFYMGKYEVTQKQWRDVLGTSPSYFKGDNLPVETVSWNDVQDFIKKLNEKEGGSKYRLPSEAE